jgi:hypothetical protein
MTITEYENLSGEPMVLIVDEENNKAQSMTKAHYEELQKQADQPIGGNI